MRSATKHGKLPTPCRSGSWIQIKENNQKLRVIGDRGENNYETAQAVSGEIKIEGMERKIENCGEMTENKDGGNDGK